MNDIFLLCICFIELSAIVFLLWKLKQIEKKNNKQANTFHTSGKSVGYLLIKRDTQGAQASVRFNPDFDLFKYKNGDYIFLEINVEEVGL